MSTTQGIGAFAAIERDDRARPRDAYRVLFPSTGVTKAGARRKGADEFFTRRAPQDASERFAVSRVTLTQRGEVHTLPPRQGAIGREWREFCTEGLMLAPGFTSDERTGRAACRRDP